MKKVLKCVVITIVGWIGADTLLAGTKTKYYLIKRMVNGGIGLIQAAEEMNEVLGEWSQQ